MSMKTNRVGVLYLSVMAIIVIGLTLYAVDNNAMINRSMEVVAVSPLQVTVMTPDGQKLLVANPYPKIQVGWYVTLKQNSEAGWEIDEWYQENPRR